MHNKSPEKCLDVPHLPARDMAGDGRMGIGFLLHIRDFAFFVFERT